MTATISTPVTIQNMTSAYVSFTSHVLKAFDLWDQAEALTKRNKGERLCAAASVACRWEVFRSRFTLSHEAKRQALSLPGPSALFHNQVPDLP